MSWFTRFADSPSSYSLTIVWVAGIAVAAAISEGAISLSLGVVGFSLIVLFAVVLAMWREVRVVPVLVVSLRSELLEHIDELTIALKDAGVPVPPHQRQQTRRATDPPTSTAYRERRR